MHKTKLDRCREIMRYLHQNTDKVHTADSLATHFKCSVATIRSVLYDAAYRPVFTRSELDRRVILLSGQWPGGVKFNLERETDLFKKPTQQPTYSVKHLNKADLELLKAALSPRGYQKLGNIMTKDMVSPLKDQDYKDYYDMMNLARQLMALLSIVRSPDPVNKAIELIDEPDKWIFKGVIETTKYHAAKRTDRKTD